MKRLLIVFALFIILTAAPAFAAIEICNGIDDDLDGLTDEGFTPSLEICNLFDDDCNGSTDDTGYNCMCPGNFDCDRDVDSVDNDGFFRDLGRGIFFMPCTECNPCFGDFTCDRDVDTFDIPTFETDFGRNQFFRPCYDASMGCVPVPLDCNYIEMCNEFPPVDDDCDGSTNEGC